MKDTDGWNNLGEHYHGDDKLIAIQAVDSLNPQTQHVWGTTIGDLTEEGDGPMDRRYTGQIHGVAPLTAQVHMMRFRGIDTPVFGDDPSTNCNPNPSHGLQETGCEYCMCDTTGTDLCCLEIPVIEVIVTVQGNVPGKPQNLCLNANVETNYPNVVIQPGNTANVSIDIQPNIPGTQLIPITLDLGDTNVAAFDGGSRSVVIREGQTNTLTGTGIGDYEIVPKLLFGSSPDLDDPDTAVPCHKRESSPGARDGGTGSGTVFKIVVVETSPEDAGRSDPSVPFNVVQFTASSPHTSYHEYSSFREWVSLGTQPAGAYDSYARTKIVAAVDVEGTKQYGFRTKVQVWVECNGDSGTLSATIIVIPNVLEVTYTPQMNVGSAAHAKATIEVDPPNMPANEDHVGPIAVTAVGEQVTGPRLEETLDVVSSIDHYEVNNHTGSRCKVLTTIGVGGAVDGHSWDLARGGLKIVPQPGTTGDYVDVQTSGGILLTTRDTP